MISPPAPPGAGSCGERIDRLLTIDPSKGQGQQALEANPTVEKLADALVDVLAEPRYLAFGDAGHPHSLDQVVHRPRRDALNISLLDDRGQRLLGEPPRRQKAREIRALPELRDTQLDRPGPRLPDRPRYTSSMVST